jgi:hypothetical protein
MKPGYMLATIAMEVLVFKTNLRYKKQVNALKPHIDKLEGILRWNVDLYDTDRILRIESQDLCPRTVEDTLKGAGYYCEELL